MRIQGHNGENSMTLDKVMGGAFKVYNSVLRRLMPCQLSSPQLVEFLVVAAGGGGRRSAIVSF